MSYSVFPQAFFIIVACISFVYFNKRAQLNNKEQMFTNICRVLFAVYLAVFLWLAVFSRNMGEGRILRLTPFAGYLQVLINYATFDVLKQIFENILVFIPFGVLFCQSVKLKKDRRFYLKGAAAGAVFSIAVETVQYIFSIGFAETDDVINNTFGCVIGCGIYSLCQKIHSDESGIHISKGWVFDLLPAAVCVTAMFLIELYRETVLCRMY